MKKQGNAGHGMGGMTEDKRIFTMAEEKPSKAVTKMGIPVMLGMMFMVVYNIVDTFFIGMLHDDYQLAAANLSYPVLMIMIALSAIVASGGASFIARCIGAKEMDKANHTLMIGFEMILIGAVIISIVGMIFINNIVNLLGADSDTFQYTKDYAGVIIIGAFFMMGNYTFGQLLRSEGSVMQSMVGMLAGTAANIVLDPIFIFALHMEIKGAAIATVLGNAIGVAFFLYYYVAKKTILNPGLKHMKPDMRIILEILRVGFPHTLEQLFTTIAMVVLNNLAALYGGLAVAAMGIANKLMTFGTYIYQGFTAGCQPLFGFNYGARNYKRLKSIIISGIKVSTAIELGVMVVFGLAAPFLIGLFTDSEAVIQTGTTTLRAFMLILPFVSATSISRNTYNAMGKPIPSFAITVIRQMVLYVPLMFLLNGMWGYKGLIHAQPASEFICMILAVAMLMRTISRLEEKDKAEADANKEESAEIEAGAKRGAAEETEAEA